MKKTILISALTIPSISSLTGATVFGGDFQAYKPGTGYTVTAQFPNGSSWSAGVGDGLSLVGGTITYSDGSTPGASGDAIPDLDLPGWTSIQGNTNALSNGVGGTTGLNMFAAWGGDARVQTTGSLGTILGGETITITAMVGGPASGPIQGPLAFHLVAGGVQLTPTSSVDPALPHTDGTFQMISRTYDATALAGSIGASTSIILGVEDANDFGNRVIFDDVTIDGIIPEPSSAILAALGGLALMRRRRS